MEWREESLCIFVLVEVITAHVQQASIHAPHTVKKKHYFSHTSSQFREIILIHEH